MKYTINKRVGFSEVGPDKEIKLTSMVNYFQDCSTFQSEDIGLGMDVLKKRGRVWVLNSWQIEVKRYAKMGEYVSVTTWANGFSGLYGTRNFLMEDRNGEVLAAANSIWVFMDLVKGRPAKPGKEDIENYGIDDPYPMEYAPRKISLPVEVKDKPAFYVKREQIDPNHHMNNEQYIAEALECLPEGMKVRKLRAEYKKSAMYKDKIIPKVAEEETRFVVELCAEDGKPYAVIETIGEK